MQKLGRLPEFLAHFGSNTLLGPGKAPLPTPGNENFQRAWDFSFDLVQNPPSPGNENLVRT